MDKKKSIEALQFFVTGLSEGAFVHKVQGQVFKSQGFTKLGEKYVGHFTEEMEWVEKFVDRILDLGGEVKIDKHEARELICDPVEYIKADLAIQQPGVELLRKCMESVKEDPTTYDILKAYLLDEEEDQYWSEEQLDIIEKIGVQNWLMKQM
jgi:bacterioferritin